MKHECRVGYENTKSGLWNLGDYHVGRYCKCVRPLIALIYKVCVLKHPTSDSTDKLKVFFVPQKSRKMCLSIFNRYTQNIGMYISSL